MNTRKVYLTGAASAKMRVKTVRIDHSHFVANKCQFVNWVVDNELDVIWGFQKDGRQPAEKFVSVQFETNEIARTFLEVFEE